MSFMSRSLFKKIAVITASSLGLTGSLHTKLAQSRNRARAVTDPDTGGSDAGTQT